MAASCAAAAVAGDRLPPPGASPSPPIANRGDENVNPPALDLVDDYLKVTGTGDPLELASWLEAADPAMFAWTTGNPTRRYSQSLAADGGIFLAFGRRRPDGLEAPQSDARDSDDWLLEVPGKSAAGLLQRLQKHHRAAFMQCPRRDIAWTFRPDDPAHVYAVLDDLIAQDFGRRAWRHGPSGEPWQSVTLQTHPKPSQAPRFVILYDKHAQDPDCYPDLGTLRLEFRFTPEKKPQKLALFWESAERTIDSWRFARRCLEAVAVQPRAKSFTWLPPSPDAEFEKLTRCLVQSYGPTIRQGISRQGSDYLRLLAIAAMLQEADAVAVVEPGTTPVPG